MLCTSSGKRTAAWWNFQHPIKYHSRSYLWTKKVSAFRVPALIHTVYSTIHSNTTFCASVFHVYDANVRQWYAVLDCATIWKRWHLGMHVAERQLCKTGGLSDKTYLPFSVSALVLPQLVGSAPRLTWYVPTLLLCFCRTCSQCEVHFDKIEFLPRSEEGMKTVSNLAVKHKI